MRRIRSPCACATSGHATAPPNNAMNSRRLIQPPPGQGQQFITWAACLLHEGLMLSQARVGNVQLMNWKNGCLEIEAQSGFGDEFLNFFKQVYFADVSACARAFRKRSSIVIEDVTTDQQFAPCCEILTRAGVRAVQSTPMISSGGALVGILSTHFPILHRPREIEMRNLRHAAQVAADALILIRRQCPLCV